MEVQLVIGAGAIGTPLDDALHETIADLRSRS